MFKPRMRQQHIRVYEISYFYANAGFGLMPIDTWLSLAPQTMLEYFFMYVWAFPIISTCWQEFMMVLLCAAILFKFVNVFVEIRVTGTNSM